MRRHPTTRTPNRRRNKPHNTTPKKVRLLSYTL